MEHDVGDSGGKEPPTPEKKVAQPAGEAPHAGIRALVQKSLPVTVLGIIGGLSGLAGLAMPWVNHNPHEPLLENFGMYRWLLREGFFEPAIDSIYLASTFSVAGTVLLAIPRRMSYHIGAVMGALAVAMSLVFVCLWILPPHSYLPLTFERATYRFEDLGPGPLFPVAGGTLLMVGGVLGSDRARKMSA